MHIKIMGVYFHLYVSDNMKPIENSPSGVFSWSVLFPFFSQEDEGKMLIKSIKKYPAFLWLDKMVNKSSEENPIEANPKGVLSYLELFKKILRK